MTKSGTKPLSCLMWKVGEKITQVDQIILLGLRPVFKKYSIEPTVPWVNEILSEQAIQLERIFSSEDSLSEKINQTKQSAVQA